MKKVLLIVIDAATPRVVCPAIQTGRLRVLRQLARAGVMSAASVTIFPSITPAATTSIVTGAYPAEHGIAGASWYDETRQEIAYYGDDFWVIAREGFGAFIRDFLIRLNGDRLTAPTLWEMVERAGRSGACLNYLVFRGIRHHRVKVPELIAAMPGVPLTETVDGPTVLCLGDFIATRTLRGHPLHEKGGLLHRFGMDDASTGALLGEIIEDGALPDFTVAYFADNDYRSHEVGPHAALPVLDRVDRMLGAAFDAAGGVERFLAGTCVMVTSDHGHCEVLADRARAVICLDQVLGAFRLAQLGRPWRDRDEIMICPNMRAAQIYLHHETPGMVRRLVFDALKDPRVEHAIWRTALTREAAPGYTVAAAGGTLEFWRGDGGSACERDPYGTGWSWSGEASILGLDTSHGVIETPDFPNAFERIAGALDGRASGEVWLTASPGCEFEVPGGEAHAGGASHGALHALDSLCPLILAGAPPGISIPPHVRSVDIAPLCMAVLGIPMRYRPGDPRACSPGA